MKKLISAVLATAIAGTAFAAAPTALAKTTTYKLGDTNMDGALTVSDVTEIQRVIAQLNADKKGYIKLLGDVNGGGLDITLRSFKNTLRNIRRNIQLTKS